MNTELDRLDYFILKLLNKEKCTNYFESITVYEIIRQIKLSRQTVYRRLKKLQEMGYVEKGCKSIQADTFYILKKGIDIVERKGDVTND